MITIAIPIFNAMPYLRDTIQSVVNQTYKDWVLYLINDGSTDNSLSVMQEFALNDSRIKIIDDGQHKGLIARLNQSITMCNTKYYARMDADDIMCIRRIEEQFKFMASHPEVDVCGTSIITIDNENRIVGSGFSEGVVDGFIHPTIFGKAEWFKANPYADWAIRAEDYELWIRTSRKSNFYAIGKPLLFYREYGVPTFKKYYLSQKTIIRIASHYKDYGKSFFWSVKTTCGTYVKVLLYSIFAFLGKTDKIVAMRKRKPIPAGLRLGEDDLNESIKKD